MVVYFLGELQTNGWGWYKEYKKTSEPLVKKHGGKYLIKGGKSHKLEGAGALPSAYVLLEFPDEESARGFYNDPDYAPMIKLRQMSEVETDVVIIDGFNEETDN